MTLHIILICLGAGAGTLVTLAIVRLLRSRRSAGASGEVPKRILFPFLGGTLSEPALAATLRLAGAEHATLVPVFLLEVPMALQLDAPAGAECGPAFAMLEAVEQRAARAGVEVEPRIERGRSIRHAMRTAMERGPWDRIVVAAGTEGSDGFSADDVAWLLRTAEAEVAVLRPRGGGESSPPERVAAGRRAAA
jgi:hypothetical protein